MTQQWKRELFHGLNISLTLIALVQVINDFTNKAIGQIEYFDGIHQLHMSGFCAMVGTTYVIFKIYKNKP